MVPHSWKIDCLETVGIHEKILSLKPKDIGRKYEIMTSRIDQWRGKSGRG